jgi:hypothetical protein
MTGTPYQPIAMHDWEEKAGAFINMLTAAVMMRRVTAYLGVLNGQDCIVLAWVDHEQDTGDFTVKPLALCMTDNVWSMVQIPHANKTVTDEGH